MAADAANSAASPLFPHLQVGAAAPTSAPTPVSMIPSLPSFSESTAPLTAVPSAPTPELEVFTSTDAEETTGSENSKNVFTELFGAQNTVAGADVMQNVTSQEDKKRRSFFGQAPAATVLPGIKQKFGLEHVAHPGQAFFKAMLALLVLSTLGFVSQTRPELSFFYENPAQRLVLAQTQFETLSSEIQVQKALTATLLLDSVSAQIDRYLYAHDQSLSEYVSQNKRAEFATQAETLRPELVRQITQIQSELHDKLNAEETQAAVTALDHLSNDLRSKDGQVNSVNLQQELHDLQTGRKLLTNVGFRSFIAGLDVEHLSDENLKAVFERFGALSSNLTSTIRSVQDQRMQWSALFDELEHLAKTVDPLFGTEFTGSLALQSLKMTSAGTVSVSGATLTQDTKNFTVVSNFIDTLNASPLFKDVANKTYQKSSQDSAYTGQFNLQMQLEKSSRSESPAKSSDKNPRSNQK